MCSSGGFHQLLSSAVIASCLCSSCENWYQHLVQICSCVCSYQTLCDEIYTCPPSLQICTFSCLCNFAACSLPPEPRLHLTLTRFLATHLLFAHFSFGLVNLLSPVDVTHARLPCYLEPKKVQKL